jgi:peptidoglycan/xylan/chitin deacetylase (PgdA/CDA1 family)
VEVGSHTVTHPILTQIEDEQLGCELSHSRSKLESELGREVYLFCYPNGNYDARVMGEVARSGYRCAVTTDPGMNDEGSDPLALKRVHTGPDLAHFVQATSGFEQLKDRMRELRLRAPGAAAGEPARLLEGTHERC